MENIITIYHNPRCSKSREAMEYLKMNDLQFEVVEYLKEKPTRKELKSILEKLGIKGEDLIRKGEEDYKSKYKGIKMKEEDWVDAMILFPKLIERPIVIRGDKAVIARPADRINRLI